MTFHGWCWIPLVNITLESIAEAKRILASEWDDANLCWSAGNAYVCNRSSACNGLRMEQVSILASL